MLNSLMNIILYGGLPLIFLLVLMEGNPIIGSFIPGQAIVIIVGFLLSTTHFINIYVLVFFIFLGAFLGDLIGFYMGRKLGISGLEKFGLDKNSKVYKSSSSFFKKFGGWSLILGREFNLTRAFIPFFAGIFKMSINKFLFLEFISSFIWSTLSIYLGYYFGVVIIAKIKFLFIFLGFLSIYLAILFYIYKSFKHFYIKNYILHKDYSIINIFIINFSLLIFIFLLFVKKWGFDYYLNESFSFIYFSNFYYFKFILSGEFLLFLVWCVFMYLIYKKNLNLILVLIWGSLISVLLSFSVSLLLKKLFDFFPFISIILLSQIVFYIFILIKYFVKNNKKVYFFNILLILFLFFGFLIKFSLTMDIYIVFVSFILSLIISEIVILLSHYKYISYELSSLIKK